MAERFDALTVREYEQNGEKKSRWTKIGVGFVSEKDGSIKVMLDANPIDGVVHLRKPLPPRDGDAPQGRGNGNRQQTSAGKDPWD